jgi:hypothetical protein
MAIRASLQANGQYTPLIVRKSDLVILAGNHTYAALCEEGRETGDVVLIDADERYSRLIVAADNRHRDLGATDPAALLEMLEALMDTGNLHGSGYSPDEVDDLRAQFGDFELAEQEFRGGFAEDDSATEARRAGAAASRVATDPVKPLVLVFTTETHPRYTAAVEALRKAWDVPAPVIVARVLRRLAASEFG